MSKQQQDDIEAPTSTVTKGPGDILQTARIEQKISIEDIARQMNLNAQILKSIEEDDYSDIQSPIFVRGYLRTYARLVGVNEDEMIKLFAQFYKKDDPDIKSIGNTIPELSSNDFRVKWMTYAVVIGLLVLLSVWWVNNYKAETAIESTGTENTTIEETEMGDTSISDVAPSFDTIQQVKPSNVDAIDATQNEVSNLDGDSSTEGLNADITDMNEVGEPDTIEEVIVKDEPEIVEDNEKTVELEPNSSTDTTEEVKNEVVDDVIVQVEPTETTTKSFDKEIKAPSGDDVLEVNVIATSWGVIRDASKFKLIQDLLSSGKRYRFVGQKPFNIFLGNGYGVELTLNGQTVDFSQHIKSSNNTARFELEN